MLGMLVAAGLVLALAVAPPQASARQLAAVEAAPATLEMKACPVQHLTTSLTGACMCVASLLSLAGGWQASKAVFLRKVEDSHCSLLCSWYVDLLQQYSEQRSALRQVLGSSSTDCDECMSMLILYSVVLWA